MPLRKGSKLDFLTAFDAYDLRRRCSTNRIKVLYGLIEDVEKYIHITASNGGYDIIYTVPMYTTDLPLFDREEMRRELINHFRRQKFVVLPINQKHVPPASFYLNWQKVKNK